MAFIDMNNVLKTVDPLRLIHPTQCIATRRAQLAAWRGMAYESVSMRPSGH
jgi:hypothetical protein